MSFADPPDKDDLAAAVLTCRNALKGDDLCASIVPHRALKEVLRALEEAQAHRDCCETWQKLVEKAYAERDAAQAKAEEQERRGNHHLDEVVAVRRERDERTAERDAALADVARLTRIADIARDALECEVDMGNHAISEVQDLRAALAAHADAEGE